MRAIHRAARVQAIAPKDSLHVPNEPRVGPSARPFDRIALAFVAGLSAGLVACVVMVKVAPPVVTVAAPVAAMYKMAGDSILVYTNGQPHIWAGYDAQGRMIVAQTIEFNGVKGPGGMPLRAK